MNTKFLSALLIVSMTTSGAFAQSINGASPESIVDTLQGLGYKANLEKDSRGDPKIRSAAAGLNYSIYFYGCTDNRDCKSIQFSAGFNKKDPMTAESMNKFNKRYRFTKAYIDEEGDPYISMDIDTHPVGYPNALFKDSVSRWESALGNFKTHINW